MTNYDEGAEDPDVIARRGRAVPVEVPRPSARARGCESCRQLRRALEQERAEVQRLRFRLQEVGQEW